jgi:hypothetical protein
MVAFVLVDEFFDFSQNHKIITLGPAQPFNFTQLLTGQP